MDAVVVALERAPWDPWTPAGCEPEDPLPLGPVAPPGWTVVRMVPGQWCVHRDDDRRVEAFLRELADGVYELAADVDVWAQLRPLLELGVTASKAELVDPATVTDRDTRTAVEAVRDALEAEQSKLPPEERKGVDVLRTALAGVEVRARETVERELAEVVVDAEVRK